MGLPRRSSGRLLRFEPLEPREMLSLQSAMQTALQGLAHAAPTIQDDRPLVTAVESPASVQAAHGALQLKIYGDGFFILDAGAGRRGYTRNDDLRLNRKFELVGVESMRLLGYRATSSGELDRTNLRSIIIPLGTDIAAPTTNARFAGVLSPLADVGEISSWNFTFYDQLGAPVQIALTVVLVEKTQDSVSYAWQAYDADHTDAQSNDAPLGQGTIVFDRNGRILAGAQGQLVVDRDPTGGSLLRAKLHFDQVSGLALVNNLGQSSNALSLLKQDGYPPGRLDRFVVNERGEVYGIADNGMSKLFGQLQLATFANPHSLVEYAKDKFRATVRSGKAILGEPHSFQFGSLTQFPSDSDIEYESGPGHPRYPWLIRGVQIDVQGDGYLVVRNALGRRFYVPASEFHLNSSNQLATPAGLTLAGFQVDADGQPIDDELTAIEVPIGSQISRATRNVQFVGQLSFHDGVGTAPRIIESNVFWNAPLGSIVLTSAHAAQIESTNAAATGDARLVDLVMLQGNEYVRPFAEGALTFSGRRGGRSLASKTLVIDHTTTLGDLARFMAQALGVDAELTTPGTQPAGAEIVDGRIRIVSRSGIENGIQIGLAAFHLQTSGSADAQSVWLRFQTVQEANGDGATTQFVVFDSQGLPVNVQLVTVIESKNETGLIYRWFAYSADNQPASPSVDTFIGTGTLSFDASGQIIAGQTASIEVLRSAPSQPFNFELDFGAVIGAADMTAFGGKQASAMSVMSQDGYPPGTLEHYTIDSSGLVVGVFDNGLTAPLGQIALASIPKPQWLYPTKIGVLLRTPRAGVASIGLPGEGPLAMLGITQSDLIDEGEFIPLPEPHFVLQSVRSISRKPAPIVAASAQPSIRGDLIDAIANSDRRDGDESIDSTDAGKSDGDTASPGPTASLDDAGLELWRGPE